MQDHPFSFPRHLAHDVFRSSIFDEKWNAQVRTEHDSKYLEWEEESCQCVHVSECEDDQNGFLFYRALISHLDAHVNFAR